jgi:hypothetical protein
VSYYNLKNVLTQSPEKIKATILSLLGVLVIIGVFGDPGGEVVAGVGIAIERFIDLFYVAPVKNAADETKTLQAIDLGKQIASPVGMYDPIPTTGAPQHLSTGAPT